MSTRHQGEPHPAQDREWSCVTETWRTRALKAEAALASVEERLAVSEQANRALHARIAQMHGRMLDPHEFDGYGLGLEEAA